MKSNIVLRPSSIKSYLSCPRKWFECFINDIPQPQNSRAAIGTASHAGVEMGWILAMNAGNKEAIDLAAMEATALGKWREIFNDAQGEMSFDKGKDDKDAERDVLAATRLLYREVMMLDSVPIPEAVEKRFTVDIDHRVVGSISGSADYVCGNTIADIKTSKRLIGANAHVLQQTIYKWLANKNGMNVKHNMIHGVIFVANPYVQIFEMDSNEEMMTHVINGLLAKLDLVYDGADPDVIFHGNTSDYLCSNLYCGSRNTCPFVHGQPFAGEINGVKS